MPQQSLTEKRIADLRPRDGQQYICWDTTQKGFGVRVSPGGAKTFLFFYRTDSGRQRWKTLGRVGTVTLDTARGLAKVDAGTVAARQDPLQQTDAARGAFSLKDVSELWMTDVKARRKPRTADLYQQALDGYILPMLGQTPMADVNQGDAIRLHESLRKTPTQGNRVLATLSALLTWSMRGNGRYRPLGHNPAFGVERYPEKKRTRYLTDDEYARVGRALRTASLSPAVKTALQLLLLTGARPIEIASLQWSFVDLAKQVLNLPDSKTGEKQIFLSTAAVQLLKKWPRHAHSSYVFPGTCRGKLKGDHMHSSTLTHAWADLRQTIQLEDVRLYDGRHSFASVGISAHGLSLPQVGGQLGHKQGASTERYAHLQRTVAQQHAEQIGGTISGHLKRRVKKS
jgi:integrase